jgi:putative ABC transport system permease protein
MGSLWRDVRYAVRTLGAARLFSLSVVLALGLGIGATTAVFSFVDAVILRPLPYRDPDRLVLMWAWKTKEVRRGISGPDLADLGTQNTVFEDVVPFRGDTGEPVKLGVQNPRTVSGFYVGAGFFSVLGVQPYLGRAFHPDEEQPEGKKTAVLSYSFWTGEFGGDRGVLGRAITLEGEAYTVVGVMPPEFFFPDQTVQVWLPIPRAMIPQERSGMSVHGVARLKPGVRLARAQSDVDVIVRRLAAAYPDTDRNLSIGLFPVVDIIIGSYRAAFWVLFGGVGLLLLIACANVAHLVLVRGLRRGAEISVRVALGATRGAILRQLLVESVVLSLVGGVAGILTAGWGLRILKTLTLTDIPRFDQAAVDWRTLLFAVATALATGLLVGLFPALRSSRENLVESLKAGGAYAYETRGRLRDLLMVSEITLAFVLVAGAGLLINSFTRLVRLDWGFRPDHLFVLDVSARDPQFPYDVSRNIDFMQQVLPRLSALPGVQSVAAAGGSPMTGYWSYWHDYVSADREHSVQSLLSLAGPGYFRTLGIPVLRGREFADGDGMNAPRAVVISTTLAARLWHGQEPLGKKLLVWDPKPEMRKRGHELKLAGRLDDMMKLADDPGLYNRIAYDVVGEVAPVLMLGPSQTDTAAAYLDYRQRPSTWPMHDESFFVRTSTPPASVAKAARTIIESEGQVERVTEDTMEERVRTALGAHTSNKLLLVVSSVASGLALALAALGIYSVLAFTTALRTHEIGVRMALGARQSEIFRMVLRRGLLLTLHGLLFGSLGAILATKTLTSYLFGITPSDPTTFAVVTLVFLLVAFLACYLPARRAMKVDPTVALRYE